MMNKYFTPNEFKQELLPWQKQGLSYTASGYGSKIPTSWKARIGKRWYRVYCMVYSNSGTCYILIRGERWIVDPAGYVESDAE